MLSIKTRSKNIDYIDYGNTPYTNWEKDWGIKGIGGDQMANPPEGVSAADICLLVDNGQWKGAVYWLYGTRTDMMGRCKIRYGILGSGQVGDEDFKLFRKLCAYVLVSRTEQDRLAKLLDSHITDEVVKELRDNQRDSKEKAYQKVQNILRQVVEELPEEVGTKVSGICTSTLECSPDMEEYNAKFRQSLYAVSSIDSSRNEPLLLLYGRNLKVSVEELNAKKIVGLVVSPGVPTLAPRGPRISPVVSHQQKKSKFYRVTLVAFIVLCCALSIGLCKVASELKSARSEIIQLREDVAKYQQVATKYQQENTGLRGKIYDLSFSFVLETGPDNWNKVLSLYTDEAISSKLDRYFSQDQFEIIGAIDSETGKLVFVYHIHGTEDSTEVRSLVMFRGEELYGEYDGCPKPKGISDRKLEFEISETDVRAVDFSKSIPSSIKLGEEQEYLLNQYELNKTLSLAQQ